MKKQRSTIKSELLKWNRYLYGGSLATIVMCGFLGFFPIIPALIPFSLLLKSIALLPALYEAIRLLTLLFGNGETISPKKKASGSIDWMNLITYAVMVYTLFSNNYFFNVCTVLLMVRLRVTLWYRMDSESFRNDRGQTPFFLSVLFLIMGTIGFGWAPLFVNLPSYGVIAFSLVASLPCLLFHLVRTKYAKQSPEVRVKTDAYEGLRVAAHVGLLLLSFQVVPVPFLSSMLPIIQIAVTLFSAWEVAQLRNPMYDFKMYVSLSTALGLAVSLGCGAVGFQLIPGITLMAGQLMVCKLLAFLPALAMIPRLFLSMSVAINGWEIVGRTVVLMGFIGGVAVSFQFVPILLPIGLLKFLQGVILVIGGLQLGRLIDDYDQVTWGLQLEEQNATQKKLCRSWWVKLLAKTNQANNAIKEKSDSSVMKQVNQGINKKTQSVKHNSEQPDDKIDSAFSALTNGGSKETLISVCEFFNKDEYCALFEKIFNEGIQYENFELLLETQMKTAKEAFKKFLNASKNTQKIKKSIKFYAPILMSNVVSVQWLQQQQNQVLNLDVINKLDFNRYFNDVFNRTEEGIDSSALEEQVRFLIAHYRKSGQSQDFMQIFMTVLNKDVSDVANTQPSMKEETIQKVAPLWIEAFDGLSAENKQDLIDTIRSSDSPFAACRFLDRVGTLASFLSPSEITNDQLKAIMSEDKFVKLTWSVALLNRIGTLEEDLKKFFVENAQEEIFSLLTEKQSILCHSMFSEEETAQEIIQSPEAWVQYLSSENQWFYRLEKKAEEISLEEVCRCQEEKLEAVKKYAQDPSSAFRRHLFKLISDSDLTTKQFSFLLSMKIEETSDFHEEIVQKITKKSVDDLLQCELNGTDRDRVIDVWLGSDKEDFAKWVEACCALKDERFVDLMNGCLEQADTDKIIGWMMFSFKGPVRAKLEQWFINQMNNGQGCGDDFLLFIFCYALFDEVSADQRTEVNGLCNSYREKGEQPKIGAPEGLKQRMQEKIASSDGKEENEFYKAFLDYQNKSDQPDDNSGVLASMVNYFYRAFEGYNDDKKGDNSVNDLFL